jgi:hypothetical protein
MNSPPKILPAIKQKISRQHTPAKPAVSQHGNKKKNAAAKMGRIVQRYQGK